MEICPRIYQEYQLDVFSGLFLFLVENQKILKDTLVSYVFVLVLFFCILVSPLLLCSRLLACVMFLVETPKKTPNGGPGIYCLAVFFLHQRLTRFISVPKGLGLWFHMAVVHNSILKKAVDEELSLNEL